MTRDVRCGDWATVVSGDGLRVESTTPSPGVLVLAVGGALTPVGQRALTRLLAEQVVNGPAVLLLDLSEVTTVDHRGAGVLVAASREAHRHRVAVELVVSTYGVAKQIQLTDPDLLRGAWRSLPDALATVCGTSSPESFPPAAQPHERQGAT